MTGPPEINNDEYVPGIRICEDHAKALRQALVDRGLGSLIADDNELASRNFAQRMATDLTIDNYEPCLEAQLNICAATVAFTGQLLGFVDSHNQEVCPLCFLNEIHTLYGGTDCHHQSFDTWIDEAADEQLEVWKSLGESG